MIFDSIENVNKYINSIPQGVIDFLLNLNSKTPVGRYEIDSNCFANIDIYSTKNPERCKLEAHREYIDIQMLLEGVERLDCTSIKDLLVSEEYDSERDVMFFDKPQKQITSVVLEPFNFILLYPHEAHIPQMNMGVESKLVKKVVVKIKNKSL